MPLRAAQGTLRAIITAKSQFAKSITDRAPRPVRAEALWVQRPRRPSCRSCLRCRLEPRYPQGRRYPPAPHCWPVQRCSRPRPRLSSRRACTRRRLPMPRCPPMRAISTSSPVVPPVVACGPRLGQRRRHRPLARKQRHLTRGSEGPPSKEQKGPRNQALAASALRPLTLCQT
jgi:hypothetical protein